MALLNLSHCYFLWLATVAFISLMLTAQYAGADTGDTFNVTAGSTWTYDSNLFRRSDSVSAVHASDGKPTRADQIIISSATFNLNKRYSMQRFEASGSLVDNRYHNFQFLNFLAKNGSAAWNWYLTPYLYGRLSGSHSEALNNFAALTGFINSQNRNLRTTDTLRFEGTFEVDRAWHIVGGVNQTISKNSLINIQDFNTSILSIDGGVRYALPSGSSLTYRIRSGQGEFVNRPEPIGSPTFFDTRFNELENEMRLIWPVTGKASIDARVGYLERKHAHFAERDFAGFVGNFNFNWAITSKTRVTASWVRDLSNSQTANAFIQSGFTPFSSSYTVGNRFFLEPVWQITEKTALRLRYDYSTRDFLGAVISSVGGIPVAGDRQDSQHTGLIELDWRPVRAIFLSASLRKDHRFSNLKTYEFDAVSASVTARLNF
jgi:exopolysaccharide biosynthesis operon protein EpsL